MKCPKCGSQNVSVQAVTNVKEKKKKGVLYWLFIGWWLEVLEFILFGFIKLLCVLFGKHTKTVSETHSEAVCQSCGYRWKV